MHAFVKKKTDSETFSNVSDFKFKPHTNRQTHTSKHKQPHTLINTWHTCIVNLVFVKQCKKIKFQHLRPMTKSWIIVI